MSPPPATDLKTQLGVMLRGARDISVSRIQGRRLTTSALRICRSSLCDQRTSNAPLARGPDIARGRWPLNT